MNIVDSSAWLEFFADADSIILTTARLYNALIWTQDQDFEGLPDVRYFPKRLI